MPTLNMFIPLVKIDEPKRLVYGVATAESEDRAGEICDYASTKPLYEIWSDEISRSTKGKSLGNVRSMHGAVAAGKITKINFNDEAKQIEICAKIIDDAEWLKVEEGVYTGFSQGGTYVKRWTDPEGAIRYTASPNEISLVDLPCLPEASFEIIKGDGRIERRHFNKGLDIVARMASLVEELDLIRTQVSMEEVSEGDGSKIPVDLTVLVSRAAAILRNMVSEETEEFCKPDSPPSRAILNAQGKRDSAKVDVADFVKAGARNNSEDAERIQYLHDTSVELGAACSTHKLVTGGMEKRFDALSHMISDVLQRVKKIEDQPLPLPFAGPARSISKQEDSDQFGVDTTVDQLLSNPDALSVLAIKLAQRNGRGPISR